MNAALGTPEHDALLAAMRERVRAKIRNDIAREVAAADALRAAVVPIVATTVATAREAGHCQRVWLFGSFVWGRPTDASDIDLLVEGDADEVAYHVGRATSRDVHAHALATAPASLVERCVADGLVL